MGMIPKSTIDEIYDAARIEEVVGDYVHLKKRGANYLGLCPFHNEKTPSFIVSPAKGIYKCFGCSAGGNAVSFIMDLEHISYPEALKQLAKKYQIQIEEEEVSPEQKQRLNKRENLYLLNEFAEKYFRSQLKTEQGQLIAQPYIKDRKISTQSVETFKIGFLANIKDGFTKYALSNGYSKALLEETGLSIFRDGKGFDRYRDRLIFPIHSLSGRTIGFGARILKNDKKLAKYVNSPESEVYHKSKILYGILQAKKSIVKQDYCILVEGYTDVVALHQSGIENVVASSGTALTKDQVRLIKRFTDNLTVIFDGDNAGIKASLRGIDIILEFGLNVNVLLLPDGEDPDSFSKGKTEDEIKEYITKQSQNFIDFKIDLFRRDGDQSIVEKTKWLRSIIRSISKVPDPLKRTVFIQDAAPKLEFDEKVLFTELDNQIKHKFDEERKEEEREIKRKAREQGIMLESGIQPQDLAPETVPLDVDIDRKKTSNLLFSIEFQLLRILLHYHIEAIQIEIESEDEKADPTYVSTTVLEFIHHELEAGEFNFTERIHQDIYEEITRLWAEFPNTDLLPKLLRSENIDHVKYITHVIHEKYQLANWEKKEIYVVDERVKLERIINQLLWRFQLELARLKIKEIETQLKQNDLPNESRLILLEKYTQYLSLTQELQFNLGREV